MTQASVRASDRVVIQVGRSLGPRSGCDIVELTSQQETALHAAFNQPHGNVYLSAAGAVTFDPYIAPAVPPPDPQIAQDKALVTAFFDNPSGTATDTQRDNVTKAVIRYLRRSGNDA